MKQHHWIIGLEETLLSKVHLHQLEMSWYWPLLPTQVNMNTQCSYNFQKIMLLGNAVHHDYGYQLAQNFFSEPKEKTDFFF